MARKAYTTEEFIERAKKIHGDTYDYSKVDYKKTKTKVTIICPKHGEFEQIPQSHLNGTKCPYCGHENAKRKIDIKTKDKREKEFIKNAIIKYGNFYDYSNVKYVNNTTPVEITCPKHGIFKQTPHNHLSFIGCKLCSNENRSRLNKKTTDEFIDGAIKIHGDKYDYSETEYNGANEKVKICCKKHGFFWQTAHNHLKGAGCPSCNESKLESEIDKLLDEHSINHIRWYGNKWMGAQTLDFYMPEINVAIECQGGQHFEPVELFGGGEQLEIQIKRDALKRQKCKENGVELIYYADEKYKEYINEKENKAFFNKEKLLEYIIEKQSCEKQVY